MPGTSAIEFRHVDIPGTARGLIVGILPDGREAMLGICSPGEFEERSDALGRGVASRTRKAAANVVAETSRAGIVSYLAEFLHPYADEDGDFDDRVRRSLALYLPEPDPFRLAVYLTKDLGIAGDRRIIAFAEELIAEVDVVARRDDLLCEAASAMGAALTRSSPFLRGVEQQLERLHRSQVRTAP